MKEHNRLLKRAWILPIIGVVIIAAHVILPYLLWHTGLSVGLVSGVTILVVIKHLGLLGSLSALLRRRARRLEHSTHASTIREQNPVNEECEREEEEDNDAK